MLYRICCNRIQINNFEINVYDNSSSVTDLKVVVFVNNKLKLINTDYTIDKTNDKCSCCI